MTERHKELYRRFSQAALPVACVAAVWLAVERAEHKERLYQETPSIPFQPFCIDDRGNWAEDIRPIRDVTMSEAFRKEVRRAMAKDGTTVHLANGLWTNGVVRSNPHPILVTPKLFNDGGAMIGLTRDALNGVHGISSIRAYIEGKPIDPEKYNEPSRLCRDIEGKVKEL